MSDQNHTPGSWELIEIQGMLGSSSLAVRSDGEGIICEVNKVLDEYDANARLIAAAPELLALLARMTGLLERQKLVAGEDEVEGKYLLLVQDARAAIAKAEGK